MKDLLNINRIKSAAQFPKYWIYGLLGLSATFFAQKYVVDVEAKSVATIEYDFSKLNSLPSDAEVSIYGGPAGNKMKIENVKIIQGKGLSITQVRKGKQIEGGEITFNNMSGYGRYSTEVYWNKPLNKDTAVTAFAFEGDPNKDYEVINEFDIEIIGGLNRVDVGVWKGPQGHTYKSIPLDLSPNIKHLVELEIRSDSITWFIDAKEVYKLTDKTIMPKSPKNFSLNVWSGYTGSAADGTDTAIYTKIAFKPLN
jgi:beta-glucanase (GH16 family)